VPKTLVIARGVFVEIARTKTRVRRAAVTDLKESGRASSDDLRVLTLGSEQPENKTIQTPCYTDTEDTGKS
jgi:hypothetical protein